MNKKNQMIDLAQLKQMQFKGKVFTGSRLLFSLFQKVGIPTPCHDLYVKEQLDLEQDLLKIEKYLEEEKAKKDALLVEQNVVQ